MHSSEAPNLRISCFPQRKASRYVVYFLIFFFMSLGLSAGKRECVWEGVEKIIAVGDLHGDYDNFVKILRKAGLVDDALHWIAGRTHLVQTGDIMDRGNQARKIFDLIKRLEQEAEQAGGMVHMLLGNHEELNITGMALSQPGYVPIKQFLAFLPDKFRKKKEEEFRHLLEKSLKSENSSDSLPSTIEEYWDNLKKDIEAQRAYTINFNQLYGKWIIEHNAVIRINDIIFVHGGVGERYSRWSLEEINETLRRELTAFRLAYKTGRQLTIHRRILYEPDSPLWFRDFALKSEESYEGEVDRILKNLGARYMVIAHTPHRASPREPQSMDELSRFHKKIWTIDTGISDAYGGILSYLVIEGGTFNMEWWRDEE